MTMEQRQEQPVVTQEKKGEPNSSLSVTPQVVSVKDVKQPNIDGLNPEQQEVWKQKAAETVKKLVEAKGSGELEVEDTLANIGLKDQRTVGLDSADDLKILQERMGRLMEANKGTPTGKVMEDLEELESTLNKISPNAIEKEFWFRVLGMFPFFGNRLIKILKTAARRRQTVAEFITNMQNSLIEGREMINLDNAQLKVLYKKIEGFQVTVRQNAYLAYAVMESLEKEIKETQDPAKRGRLQNALWRVSVRYQDLRALEESFEQAFASITTIRESNSLLMGSIDRMLTLGMQVVQVAFAIAVALAHQGLVLDAYRKTRDFIGNMMVANATAIARHVQEIGDIYKEPVVAMKKLEESHTKLMQAQDELDKLKVQGVAIAKENGEKLRKMAEELRNRSQAAQATETLSIEASDLLSPRPVGAAADRPQI